MQSNMTISYPSRAYPLTSHQLMYMPLLDQYPYIYENYNLIWIFTVDSGFFYQVRLHLCEVEQNITKVNQRVFEIFLNNQTAEWMADVIALIKTERSSSA